MEIKKPKTGGEVLREKHGADYFRKLAKKGWKKRREQLKKWEEAQMQARKKK